MLVGPIVGMSLLLLKDLSGDFLEISTDPVPLPRKQFALSVRFAQFSTLKEKLGNSSLQVSRSPG